MTMENLLFGFVTGLIIGAALYWLTQRVAEGKQVKVINKVAHNINDYETPTPLPMLRPFKVKRSTQLVDNVITVTWKYKDAKSYRTFTLDDSKFLVERQAAFKQFCKEQEFGFYMRNINHFPLRKGKKK